MAGARAVFATDINPERLEMAQQMGADLVLDARDDVVARLRAETDGNGVDIVLEMSGAAAALHQGLAALTNGGRVSLLGTHAVPATIDLSRGGHLQGHPRLRHHRPAAVRDLVPDDGAARGGPRRHRRSSPTACRWPTIAKAFDLVAAGHAGKIVLLPQEGKHDDRMADRNDAAPIPLGATSATRSTSCKRARTSIGRCAS